MSNHSMVNMILDMDMEDPAIDETIRDWVKVSDNLSRKISMGLTFSRTTAKISALRREKRQILNLSHEKINHIIFC